VNRVIGTERGRISLRSDPDSERADLLVYDDSVLSFGRGADCDIRFAHAPVQDREVPRRCGWIVVANGRIVVQVPDRDRRAAVTATDRDVTVRRPVVVVPDDAPARALSDGEVWGPSSEIFTISVSGSRTWDLDVINFRDPVTSSGPASDLPTVQHRLELSGELWTVLHAYAEPVLRGERFPATHDQVAKQVHWNKMTVRRRLERIYDEFYLRRIEMPDVADMRIKVVEAAMNHGLLTVAPPTPESVHETHPIDATHE